MLTRFLLLLFFTSALLFGMAQSVSACSCGPRPTVLDALHFADEVVIMRVISVEKVEKPEAPKKEEDENDEAYVVDGVRSATLIVEKVFKGKLKVREEIVFGQGSGGDCLWTFDETSIGNQYLFFLTRPEKHRERPLTKPGLWYAVGCGRSSGLEGAGATESLLYLENMKKYRDKTRISGSITGGWEYPDLDVAGKKIKIIGPAKTYETKTDDKGVFEIYDLPAGKYFIEPELPAGWKINSRYLGYSSSVVRNEIGKPELKTPTQVPIMLEARRHATINIYFEVENSVRGRVLGPTAKPMGGVCVYLLQPDKGELGPSNCTDEQGRFEITSIRPGAYVLAANNDDKPSDRQPFRRIFYPNVAERERATVFRLDPGDVIENIDLVIPKLEETITITGVLRYSDGNPAIKQWLRFKVTKANDKVDGDVNQQTDASGRFTLKILKGLTGELWGDQWLLSGLFKNCPKVDEILEKSGDTSITVRTNVIELTAEENLYDVELTLPFPRCERAGQ